MKVSIAEYLINQTVRAASGLHQHAKDSPKQSTVQSRQEKSTQRVAEAERGQTSSSAYRVTISPAAMQKIAASGKV